ncbi:MAG: methyltransferase domain-containing protein [Rhodospirillaceae bacterium]|nr:methyltransferase domain-containing protein [Rhodospirillaceae bacterium]
MLVPPPMAPHGMTPDWSHDDRARQAFQRTLRETVIRKLSAGSRVVFEKRVKPRFEKENGRPFKDRHEARKEMRKDTYYQSHLSIQRAAQELMWASVTYSLDRQLGELMARAKETKAKLGSLTLDPALKIPRYIDSLDIHCMPGGYTTDLGDGDVAAGAIYEQGSYIYGSGRGGAYGDRLGHAIARYLKRNHPDFKPQRILDMGCATGNNTVPLYDAFPEAEVHGIDLGAALLRYGHVRAESLGKKIHFSQQNAEKTNFADGSFDLVVSNILFHETSRTALPRILAETRRLLRPGGLMIHLEVDQFASLDLWRQIVFDAETYNNNEPFWSTYRDMDLLNVTESAGWPKGSVVLDSEPMENVPVTLQAPAQLKSAVPGFLIIAGRK